MPDPYPNALYKRTRNLDRMMERLKITYEEIRQVITTANTAWPGKYEGQTWHGGTTKEGRSIKVLIATVPPYAVVDIITVHDW